MYLDISCRKVDSYRELKCLVGCKDQLLLCDDMQNSYLLLEFADKKFGIAYYDYGVPPNSQYFKEINYYYLGLGINFLCINVKTNKLLFNHKLNSVFMDLIYDSEKRYICVICELDIYCYYQGVREWRRSFSSIVIDFKLLDRRKVLIICDDGNQFILSIYNGDIIG